jgi:hypothetical protein
VIVQEVCVNVDQHSTLPLLLLVRGVLDPAKAGFILGAQRKVEIGFLSPLFLQYAVFIIDIVEIVDGWFAWCHATSVVT